MQSKSYNKTKGNSLNLSIDQESFDAILNGTKDKVYRSISEHTATRFIENEEENGVINLLYDSNLVSKEHLQLYGVDLCYYNDGTFPFIPKNIKFLNFNVDTHRFWDVMTVEVTDISFEPAKDNDGNTLRLSYSKENDFVIDENGKLTMWYIVFHLGKVVKTDLKRN